MRKATHADAQLLLHLYELRREPQLRKARAWVLSEFKASSWEEIGPGYLKFSDADQYLRMTLAYWEMVAALVNRGVLHAELFFDHTGEDIVTWERVKPWVAEARAAIRFTYMRQFERMVEDHLAYRKRTNAAQQALHGRDGDAKGALIARTLGAPERARGRARR
ncbi:MAG TPA: hypothetical protein VFQ05_13965 [Candidatus Eisenbacteria bacterium]|nr:hypothetical protein [Candidatus Eisenbacteria bacterium]